MALTRLCLISLVLLLTPYALVAQQDSTLTAPVPNTRSLAPGWWKYIDEAGPQLRQRTEALLASAAADVEVTQGQGKKDREAINQFFDRLRINLSAFPDLVEQKGASADPVPPIAATYNLDQYLDLDRELRQARRMADELTFSVRRTENAMRTAERRIDGRMASYLTLNNADSSIIRSGLQIMALRSEWAVAREQLRVRSETSRSMNERIDRLSSLLGEATRLLVATADEASAVTTKIDKLQTRLEKLQPELRSRQSQALAGQGDTTLARGESAWRDLLVMETSVAERAIELEISTNKLKQIWYRLELDTDENQGSISTAVKEIEESESLLTQARTDLREWQQQTERGLSALRLGDQSNSAELEKIHQDRLKTANQILTDIARAQDLAHDTDFMNRFLRQKIAAKQGVFSNAVSGIMRWLRDGWTSADKWGSASLFKLGDTPVTTFGLLRVALILFVAIWISRLFRHALVRVSSRKEGTQSAFYTVGRLAHYVIIALAIVVGLSSIGLSFANLAIVAGALGVGIGFGLQSIVSNFVSGLILLFERSLKVGDFVELESGVGGIVKEINVRSTLINTNDNLDILVPNSEFINGRLTNWTLKEESRRMHIPFGVAYGTPKDKVREVVLREIESVPYTLKSHAKPAEVWLINFGDSSLDFELVLWVKQESVRNPGRVHATYTWAIETALVENGIEIPFPQRDLHIRSGLEPKIND